MPLFLAPWLSPRARQVLDSIPVGYLDLTGNVHLSLEAPAVLIRTVGDDRDPAPASQAKRGLSGALAGRLVRELVDHDAPRQPRELTRAAGISESYTSRLLDVMTREALITRNNKEITHIDWEGLLRARAATYDLTGVNSVVPTIARQGVDEVLRKLQRGASRHEVLVTGTYAATVLAPLAVGGALMLYVRASPLIEDVRKDLALMRAREVNDADVLLLVSPDSAVFIRPEASLFNGLLGVGISQLALDCLSGPGRMPAEAEELLAWMRGNEHAWRRPSPRQTP
ncbi:hypothetical protein [Actinokineospora inagensis]|uniref:hypothetical protein n=1 Tax=Actinokineospora inagensis TaxID=103730 RepID=UPI0006884BAB|nr:hypothetical protein [Actinokineospora inagensis]